MPLQVVLVEDDEADAVLVQELLSDTGLNVSLVWCRSLAEAAAKLTDEVDCVLVDLNLPDSLGLDAVDLVLRSAPEAAVLVLTGMADETTAISAVTLGAQDYLVKGKVDGYLLGRSIRYAMERKAAAAAAAELRDTRLLAAENARLERGLLPRPLVANERVNITSRYRPGRQRALLGGDFFDVVETDDGLVRALIGDVCGHGPDEAALGVGLRFAWRGLVLAGVADPVEILRAMQRVCVAERHADGIFASICMIDIHLPGTRKEGSAVVTCAGHPAPLLAATGVVTPIPTAVGFPVGLLPGIGSWSSVSVPLPAEGGILLYTDGMTDCQVGVGEERLGVEGLTAIAGKVWQAAPEAFLEDLVRTVTVQDAGRNLDDLAVLYVTWGATADVR
ncbi:PP2C family protein-serine/threonine phosphatase [Rhizocola hellebori]|uniref:PP2C family protein-serine/threonine phosphatase n=1 Tax=Rhizocola hellebori TaxID=1392758 RepID=UPI001940A30F|nr:SpoIIE family protein phosphatase [Rhizocola hellebori]